MKDAPRLQKEILMFFNEHGIICHNLNYNYYLIMYDRKKDIVVIGPTVKASNSYRQKLSTQGITMRKIKDINAAKRVVGKGKVVDSAKMLQLLENNGEVSVKLAKHAGIENVSRAVSNLKKRGYSIGAVRTKENLIYTYDAPKQDII